MRIIDSRLVMLSGAVAVIGLTAVGTAQGVRPQQDEGMLPQLMIEVRGLRNAMEQMSSAGPRVQLALGRLQLQEQRIANQIRRLDAARASVLALQNEIVPIDRRLRNLQHSLDETDPDVVDTRKDLAQKQAQLQRAMTEQTLIEQDIATEQSRWTDFNQRLEDLERALARR